MAASGLDRRGFLVGMAAASIGASVRVAAAETEDVAAIDAHAHIWTTDVERYPLNEGVALADLKPASFTDDELLAVARPLGVRRVVLIQHEPYHGLDHSYLSFAIRVREGVFSGVSCVKRQRPPEEVESELQNLFDDGFRGVRIESGDPGASWADDDSMRRLWKLAGKMRMAICPLISPSYLEQIDALAMRFPDTTVVIDHLGGLGEREPVREEQIKHLTDLSKHKHVHVKLSAFYALGEKRPPYDDLKPLVRRALDAFGPERLMWGSDAPYQNQAPHTYQASLDFIRSFDGLSAGDRAQVLRKTAEGVFFAAG